jgi:prepilin-type N-terminal cleavage/methylation domain-containing protein
LVPSAGHRQPRTKNQERGTRNGFTLVEVTLAAVVISLGLLALFGLGHLAQRNAQGMEDDTRTAMFAEDIFASMRSVSEQLCASNNPAAWEQFWGEFAAGFTPLPILPAAAAAFSNRFDGTLWGDGRVCTNRFFSRPEVHGVNLSMPEWSARCWMEVALTNTAGSTAISTNLVRVTLHVVPGHSGAVEASRSYYTHFTEHGTLP